mmetsp:Transcript_19516/g.21165  ORF Transcript_19516/g.21165 Transcript_19516/m.21165 type:complete len:662 (+) Transcript_19516:299-2284(+)
MFEEHPPHKKQKVQANNNHPNMSERLFQRSSLVNPSFNYDEWMLRPEPTEVPLFLETPYNFCPRDDFINNTFVDEESILTYCIKVQNAGAVDVLVKAGADPNQPSKKGVTPISAAAHKGNILIMQVLISAGASVNAVNSSGSTALIQASHFGHLNAVKLLVQHNSNADFANMKGTTALMRASQEGHVEISKALLEAGVDVNRRNHEGMNALMLASQRGHADIVMLLIKAGAVMDEQTAQGSTALMLACKRGHERCAEVLVSMGAEIFMRDRRYRTARDTATRRNHINLLCWLDTQVQVRKIQEFRHKIRSQLIHELRNAYNRGVLQLIPSEQFADYLVRGMKVEQNPQLFRSHDPYDVKAIQTFHDFKNLSVDLHYTSRSIEETLTEVNHVVSQTYPTIAAAVPTFSYALKPAPRCPNYADWQWASLLYKSMSMPSGVFELIMDYMPLPRIWQWSLLRLSRRCKLAPQQAMIDMSIIMDEILKDTMIFAGLDQTNQLVKISRSPQLNSVLVDFLGMPPALLESIHYWADVQSLLTRVTEQEVIWKYPIAKKMLSATVALYRWYRQRNSAAKWLGLVATHNGPSLKLLNMLEAEEADIFEATDPGAEEGSDNELDVLPVEPDTETEFAPPGDADDAMADSDHEDGMPMGGNGHHNNIFMGPV